MLSVGKTVDSTIYGYVFSALSKNSYSNIETNIEKKKNTAYENNMIAHTDEPAIIYKNNLAVKRDKPVFSIKQEAYKVEGKT